MKEYSEEMIQTALLISQNDDQRRICEIGVRLKYVKDMLERINTPPCNGSFLLICSNKQPDYWYLLSKDKTTIGRADDCDIELQHNGISRLHAAITSNEDDWELSDADSTNALSVNGKQIQQRTLCDGDLISIGTYEVIFTKYQSDNNQNRY